MTGKSSLDIQSLGKWMQDNKVTRGELASSLGLARSTIDNYFSKGKIPRHVCILIVRYMQGMEPASSHDFVSYLNIPVKSHILNIIVQATVRKNMTIEEFIVWAAKHVAQRLVEKDKC